MLSALFTKDYFLKYATILVLPALVTGPFLADLLVSLVAIFFLLKSINQKLFRYYNKIYFKIFVVFWIYITSLSFFAEHFLISFIPSFFYIRFIIFSIAIYYLIENCEDFIHKLFIFLFITLAFVIFHALLIYFFSIDILNLNLKNFGVSQIFSIIKCPKEIGCGAVDFRISGIFYSESVLGSYLVRVCPVFLITLVILYQKKIILYQKNFFLVSSIILLILSFFVIFISGERSALGLASIFLFLLFLFSKINKKNFILLFFVLMLPIFSLVTNPNIQNRLIINTKNALLEKKKIDDIKHAELPLFKYNLFSVGHEGHFNSAYKMFTNNIFGVGIKMFRYECKKPDYQIIKYGCTTHPHNTYFNLLAEAGLFGFLIIFIIFLYISSKLINFFLKKYYFKHQINHPLLLSTLTIFITLFPFLPSGAFFNNWLSILYFFPVGFFLYYNDPKFTK